MTKGGKSTPASGVQDSSPGLRRRKSSDGKRHAGSKPIRTCWLTGKRGRKYFAEHHVMTVENDPDLTVWLCRGAHYLVTLLSRYSKLIDDPDKVADLITLARTQAGMDNRRTVVRYEEVT